MVRCPGGSFRWVSLSRPSPLLRESCHPKSEDVREGRPRTAAFTSCFGRALSAGVTRPTAWAGRDDVGLSPVSVVSHFVQATPPDTLTDHRRSPSILRCESTLLLPMLRQMTELGTPPGPKRDASWTILRLAPSSAQVAPRRWLHTPKRVRAEISVRARTHTGRIRLGHFSYHDKVAPFID